ncbi:MAG: hypothetical protein A2Z06_02190 [Candidatus Glassbacteria bacterium RBG_16_58_8]|uniref:Quinohemoprotein amine dehydrogenase gamma subunit structural domain-containing protein n=1 Tax=Candidatus Glassbacteria bacterium RBG_16_58_8 TaxID=1817866 RepID=A0A1F5YC39_9BACT|nr:MAG: hypothetical protein A2Z06_02190 [Candidatus Glassbacteria bacterium RBG_16_58_8]
MGHIEPMNKKARTMSSRKTVDVRGYSVEGCCTSYIPGWEVGSNNNLDPCPWQNDLAACYGWWFICYWGGQVPDHGDNPNWLDNCSNIQNDWTNLCVVPD